MIHELSDDHFEQLVSEAIDSLDENIINHLDNVAIVTAENPTAHQLSKGRVKYGSLLLGLYEGIPKTARGAGYSLVLPDKISIFKRPLMIISQNYEHLKAMIKNTVWHEIAHHYGLDHDRIHYLEGKKKNDKK